MGFLLEVILSDWTGRFFRIDTSKDILQYQNKQNIIHPQILNLRILEIVNPA
jgi:hypothetical protein